MASLAKMEALRDHIAADPQTRGYAGMTDAQIATDMVVTETVPAGTKTKWALKAQLHWPEVVALWDGTAGDVARSNAVFSFLSSGNEVIPAECYTDVKTFFQRAFGVASTTKANVDTLLDSDTVSRAFLLGFPNRTEATMTTTITTAKALP